MEHDNNVYRATSDGNGNLVTEVISNGSYLSTVGMPEDVVWHNGASFTQAEYDLAISKGLLSPKQQSKIQNQNVQSQTVQPGTVEQLGINSDPDLRAEGGDKGDGTESNESDANDSGQDISIPEDADELVNDVYNALGSEGYDNLIEQVVLNDLASEGDHYELDGELADKVLNAGYAGEDIAYTRNQVIDSSHNYLVSLGMTPAKTNEFADVLAQDPSLYVEVAKSAMRGDMSALKSAAMAKGYL